jgi:prepilin-type N-terminal cleavage/methylation domain-containing protein
MKSSTHKNAFSLIEVIIALAIFGILIGGILAFLPWGVDGVAKIRDRNTAMSLIDATQIELERLGFSVVEAGTHRLDGLFEPTGTPIDAAKIHQIILVARREGGGVFFEQVIQRVQQEASGGTMEIDESVPPVPLKKFVKDSGGTIEFEQSRGLPISLNALEDEASARADKKELNRWIEHKDRYFRLVCSQYSASSRHSHHISNGFLALNVEVQWPYKLYDPSNPPPEDFRETSNRFRSKFSFPIAISR